MLPINLNRDPPFFDVKYQTYLGNQFVFSVNGINLQSMFEIPIILLVNPLKAVASKSLFINIKKLACLTEARTAAFKYYFDPTFESVGRIQHPLNARSNFTTESEAQLSIYPSASLFGQIVTVLSCGPMITNISEVMVILDPGQSQLITAQVSAANTMISCELGWYEL